MTKTCSVPVTLVADPISSISYTRPTGVVLIEDWDSYRSTDWNGNQSPSIYLIDTREDDELTISYKDGTSKTYVYQNITLDDGSTTLLFANQEDTSDRIDVRNVEFTSDQSSSNYWGYGTHYFTVTAFQHTCTLEATTYPYFVQSISFTPKNSYVLTDADAYTETKRDEDWKKYDVTYYRSPEYVHGDKLTITMPSGTVLSYVYSPLLDGFSIAKNTALAANVPNLIDGNRVLMWDCSLAAEHYGIVPNWSFDLQYLDVHTSVPFEVTGRFRDVNENTPHYQDIYWLAATGITTGFEDNTYRGTNTVLRQDMAAFLFRIAKRKGMVSDEWLSEDWEPTREQLLRFDDVDESTPHFKEICWLAETGITTGYSDGTFRGSFTILRQDMAAFLFRLANLCGEVDDAWLADNWQPTAAQLRRFSDVNTSTPHFKEICWLAETGITTGYSDGTFRGYFTVLRQDMAAFLHRFDSL